MSLEKMKNQFDGIQPENDFQANPAGKFRQRTFAVLMLFVLIIPSILGVIEILTGSLSSIWEKSIDPMLPDWLNIVHF
ncbi:MAG: hypothetical protein JEZ06_09775 [Anaerolineaceae bacterium]|nr:hypothetical protein [Anaerolineaceae bacterium]